MNTYAEYLRDFNTIDRQRCTRTGCIVCPQPLAEWEWELLHSTGHLTEEPMFTTMEGGFSGEDDEWLVTTGRILAASVENYVGSWFLAHANRYGSANVSRVHADGVVTFTATTPDGSTVLGYITVTGTRVQHSV